MDLISSRLKLSQKFIDFVNLRKGVKLECLEGTTLAGKTTIGILKFILMVILSDKKYHVIAARDISVAQANLVVKDLGILDVFKMAHYYGKGNSMINSAHIEIFGKIIYIVGYGDTNRWTRVRGSQFGCVYIDEVNLADMNFIREISLRCDYMMTTSNPDDPRLEIYSHLINRCRPLKKYEKDVPASILSELVEPTEEGYVYWFFTFYDNASLTEEFIKERISKAVPGTIQYKHLIQGLRGKASGLIFPNFGYKNIVDSELVHKWVEDGTIYFRNFTCGVDTSYSSKSPDTISFIFQGITTDGKIIILDEAVFNNRDLTEPLAPSDAVPNLIQFINKNTEEWGFCRNIYIDNADEGTLTEALKYKRLHPSPHNFLGSDKRLKIVDRIKLMLGWIQQGKYLACSHCKNHIEELQTYSWDEKKISTPEDCNNHTIDASCYGWIPFRYEIGGDN